MSVFLGEQHSEFFRRSLGAWNARRTPTWHPVERLTSDIEHRLTAERLSHWFDERLRENGAHSAPLGSIAVGQALRQVRNWLMLCIIERDLSGRADLDEVCTAMTLFAEFSSRTGLRVLAAEHSARLGPAPDESGVLQDLLIIAMGKADRKSVV